MSSNRKAPRGAEQESKTREVLIDDGAKVETKKEGSVRFAGVPLFPGSAYKWIEDGSRPGYIRVFKIIAGQAVPAPWYKGVPSAMTEDAIKELWGNGTYLLQLVSRGDAEHTAEIMFERKLEIEDGDDGIKFPGEERSPKTLADCSPEEEEEEPRENEERSNSMGGSRFSRQQEEQEEESEEEPSFQSRTAQTQPLFPSQRPRFFASAPGSGGGLYQAPQYAPPQQPAQPPPYQYTPRPSLYQQPPQETALQTVPQAPLAAPQGGGTAALVAAAAPIVTGLFTMLAEGRKADQERLRYERERDERRDEARKEAEERRAEERAARDRADAENQRNFLMAMFNKQGESAKEIAEKEASREKERRDLEMERERARQAREKEDRDALREEVRLARQNGNGAGVAQNFDQTLSMLDRIAERTVQNQPEAPAKVEEPWWKPFLPLIPQILPLLLSGGSVPPHIAAMLQQASGDPNIMAKIPELLAGMGAMAGAPAPVPVQQPYAPMPNPGPAQPAFAPQPPAAQPYGYDPSAYEPAPEAYYPPQQPPPAQQPWVAPPPMSEHQQPLQNGGGYGPQGGGAPGQ